MERFDLLQHPLEGTTLIEASAGTGKTYAITCLFLRLIIEKQLPVDDILVVTFTEAATAELKARIREKLRDAIKAFSGGTTDDAFLLELVALHKDHGSALFCLKDAVRDFDRAAIFTIHGFCKRMLSEHAFESGALFDTELVKDLSSFTREIVEDFWRTHFYRASALFVTYVLNNNMSPDSLYRLVATPSLRSQMRIIPKSAIPETEAVERRMTKYFRSVRVEWPQVREKIEDIMLHHEGLKRTIYRKDKIHLWCRAMDAYCSSETIQVFPFEDIAKFTPQQLEKSIKKDYIPPRHSFFELCGHLADLQRALVDLYDERITGLKSELFDYVTTESERRKAGKNIQSFDDLLEKLSEALHKDGGEELAQSIRRTYRAALVDEFQDTDAVQCAIFEKIFDFAGHTLFLIGDPKQAIYGFRGADVFTYMGAARKIKKRHTLDKNWRSAPALVTAVNTLFHYPAIPFVYEEIPFNPVRSIASGKKFAATEGHPSALEIWYVNAARLTKLEKSLSKSQAHEIIPQAVAGEIARLLDDGKEMSQPADDGLPYQTQDIAVLVRRNMEARLIQQALSKAGIPSVLSSTGNLFESHEALDVERVLAGIAEHADENLVRVALATDIFGVVGQDLDESVRDNERWEKRLLSFRDYHDAWRRRGFMRMFRLLLARENVLPRIMAFPHGERAVTNILHLAEILHRASIEKNLQIGELVQWISERRNRPEPETEEHQLRLESDANAVKIVTVHKSKGLEYRVVFCPFIWDGSKIKNTKTPFIFHDESRSMAVTLDLGSPDMDHNRKFAETELLAENIRLFYVALTRAKERCYLISGRFKGAETSALAYVLRQNRARDQFSVVDELDKEFRDVTDEQMLVRLGTLQAQSAGTIDLKEIPFATANAIFRERDDDTSLTARTFSGTIDGTWRFASFSSLVSRHAGESYLRDHDSVFFHTDRDENKIAKPNTNGRPGSIHTFPRGTKAGTCLHDIFEHFDFACPQADVLHSLVSERLHTYGFEPEWEEVICTMVGNVITTRLTETEPELTLSSITNDVRLSELEFYYPLRPISPGALQHIFAAFRHELPVSQFPERIGRLLFSPAQGIMRGFIDLVFRWQDRYYIVDWKSNYLGDTIEHYGHDALEHAMTRGYYHLQYYIYILALHQFLTLRLPGYTYEANFGGIFYIFLRGVDPGRGSKFGIYHDRPAADMIQHLSTSLIAATHEVREISHRDTESVH